MCLSQLSRGRRDSWEGAEEHSGHAGALRTCRSTQDTQEHSGYTGVLRTHVWLLSGP